MAIDTVAEWHHVARDRDVRGLDRQNRFENLSDTEPAAAV